MPAMANPYFTLCSDFDPPPIKKCKICDVEGTRMGSVVCDADDRRMLDRIFVMTNVCVKPLFGIITPVCDECRERIDMYDDQFEPQIRDLLLQDLDPPVIIEEYDPLLGNVFDSKNSVDPEAWEENFEHDPCDPIPSFVERQITVESSEHVPDLPAPHDACEPMQDSDVPSREPQVEDPAGISDSKKLVLVDEPNKIFKHMCPICAEQCKSLISHMKIHIRKGLYACMYCRAKFRTRSLLAHHNATHTHRPFCCNLCTKTYRTVFTLKAHMKQHSRTPAYQCEICPKAFNSDSCWKIHVRAHKGEKPFPCSVCGRTFGTPYNRRVHELRHQNKRDYQCDKCPKGFFSPKELRSHKIRHIKVGLRTFPQLVDLQEAEPAKEELLSKAEGFINDHLYETVEKQCPKRFSCSSCYKSFHDESQLRLHVKRMHSAASLSKSNVRFPKIDKATAEKQLASILYSGTSFVCDVCARNFRNGRGLRQHLYVHIRGVKVHRCSRCPRVFFQIGHLQEHELTHTGQKPFSCPVCGRCFNRNYIMERHRREQHPEEIIPEASQESNPESEPLTIDLDVPIATDFGLDSAGTETRAMEQTHLLTKVDGAEPGNEMDIIATSPKKVRKKVRFSDALEVEYFNPNECNISRKPPKSCTRPGILKGSLKIGKGSPKPPPETLMPVLTSAMAAVHSADPPKSCTRSGILKGSLKNGKGSPKPPPVTLMPVLTSAMATVYSADPMMPALIQRPTLANSTGLDMDTVAPDQQNSSISESAFTLPEAEAKVNPELSPIDTMNSTSALLEAETIFESQLSGANCMNNAAKLQEAEMIFESVAQWQSGIDSMNGPSTLQETDTIFESEVTGTDPMNHTTTLQQSGTIFEPELSGTDSMNRKSRTDSRNRISTMQEDETIIESEVTGTDCMISTSGMQEDETIVEPELSGTDCMNSTSTLQEDETIFEPELSGTDSMNSPATMEEDETIVESELSGTDCMISTSTLQEDETIVEPELSPIHSTNSAESDEEEEQNRSGLLLELEITPAFDWRHRINTDLWEILGVPTSLSMLH